MLPDQPERDGAPHIALGGPDELVEGRAVTARGQGQGGERSGVTESQLR